MKSLLIGLLVVCCPIYAKSFGVVGFVFPVAERSFLTLIEERLEVLRESGELEAENQRWLKQIAAFADRSTHLGLLRAKQKVIHYFVPEIRLTNLITDSRGQVLFPAGIKVNALQAIPSYQPCWLFFNADDKAQILWAKSEASQCLKPKFILTGGSVRVAEKALNAVIYFDQQGRLTQKLNIGHVPTKVVREGDRLRIVELVIKENGDVV